MNDSVQDDRSGSRLAAEIAEIPGAAAGQISSNLDAYISAGRELADLNPRLFVTCARGTSDHAASFFKYIVESRLGLPVASIGPSIASIYGAGLRLENAVCLTISQSGASPDLVALQAGARRGGALTVALLNTVESPVGRGAQCVLPVGAGPELAVAATKSFVNSMIAVCGLFAGMARDQELAMRLRDLPPALEAALACDWSCAADRLAGCFSIFAISRGPSMSAALEAALKLKEVCRLHAEACSAAEFQHGPVSLAGSDMAVLAFLPEDEGRASVIEATQTLRRAGARVHLVGGRKKGEFNLPASRSPHPLCAPICQIAGFYRFTEQLGRHLGVDCDRPHLLSKVTRTL